MERRQKEITALAITTISFILMIVFIAYVLLFGFESVKTGSMLLLILFIVWVAGLVAAVTYSETGWEIDGLESAGWIVLAFVAPFALLGLGLYMYLKGEEQMKPSSLDPQDHETIGRL